MARNKVDDHPTQGFSIIFAAAQVVGLIAVGLIAIWCSKYLGGFGWTDATQRFNWHPLLMTLGFVYAYGNGMMIYRVLHKEEKPKLKLIHGGINAFALFCALIAQIAVFSFHNEKGIPNLYTLHSWIGLGVTIIFTGMLATGVIVFLLPGTPLYARAKVLPLHVFTGNVLLALIVVTVISGIKEKALFKFLNGAYKGPQYGSLPPEAMLLNFAGIAVVVFAILVGYITTQPQFKRQPLPQEIQTSSVVMTETTH